MATQSLPPVLLPAGWYWYHFIRSETLKEWEAFHAANMATLKLAKTFAGDTARAQVVVFELRGPIQWTLPGKPSKAPKKDRTTLRDLSTAPEYNTPDLVELAAELAGDAKATASTIGTVGTVLLWGGAAIVLFNLWSWTKAPARAD